MNPAHNAILARFTEVLATQGLEAARRAVAPMERRAREVHPAIHATAKEFGITPSKLIWGGKARVYSRPRQVAMFVMHELGLSYPAIARELKLTNHTTCLSGARACEESMALSGRAEKVLAGMRETVAPGAGRVAA